MTTHAVTDTDLINEEYADLNRFKTLYRKILDDRENTNARLPNFVSGYRIIYAGLKNVVSKPVNMVGQIRCKLGYPV